MAKRIGIIGVGKVAQIHVDAIGKVDGLVLAGGCDSLSKPTWWGEVPWFPSLRELVHEHMDVVIIATPSATHPHLVRAVWAEMPDIEILVEKPLAVTSSEARALFAQARPGALTVLYHAAYAPEVSWADKLLRSWQVSHGPVESYLCFFSDPYDSSEMGEAGRAAYGSSWIDSGINCLSILRRLGLVDSVTDLAWDPAQLSTAAAHTMFYGTKRGTIITQWTVTAASKSTVLFFGDGAVAVLDHQGTAGRVVGRSGEVEDIFGMSPDVPRLVRHYVALFRREVVERQSVFQPSDHIELHAMLLDLL